MSEPGHLIPCHPELPCLPSKSTGKARGRTGPWLLGVTEAVQAASHTHQPPPEKRKEGSVGLTQGPAPLHASFPWKTLPSYSSLTFHFLPIPPTLRTRAGTKVKQRRHLGHKILKRFSLSELCNCSDVSSDLTSSKKPSLHPIHQVFLSVLHCCHLQSTSTVSTC